MARNVKDILAKLPESRRKAIVAGADAMFAEEMTLAEIRKMVLGTQAQLAKKMGIKQAAVSRLERRADMHLSTLKQIIDAMGGKIQVVAQFTNRPSVPVNLFDALAAVDSPPKGKKASQRTGSRAAAIGRKATRKSGKASLK
jgi:transcriptional regulator with XRE-family HTH domain